MFCWKNFVNRTDDSHEFTNEKGIRVFVANNFLFEDAG